MTTTVVARPLAWGGWEFVYSGHDFRRSLQWWPGDTTLSMDGRPCPGAPVETDSGKAARAAAEAFRVKLDALASGSFAAGGTP